MVDYMKVPLQQGLRALRARLATHVLHGLHEGSITTRIETLVIPQFLFYRLHEGSITTRIETLLLQHFKDLHEASITTRIETRLRILNLFEWY